MDHPNIAQVYDGGATESGRPFFVMELVHGVPITEFCDHYRLPIERRLQLFMDVCRAIQHAHQKGIIHRDVKPSNVLVTLHDDKPNVKVIDFGVAKAIDQELVQHTMHTRFTQMVGTPAYMSPEQAELRPLGVDTRTDVYSLGVLLYELLTGATPIDRKDLESSSYDELRRIIREEEPVRPSTRISTLQADAATTVAERRHTTGRQRLSQQLRGELDSIVLKCLEKDRSRRYETASALADDVERFLKNEPIIARSPSAVYRIRKFVRRNRVLAAALAAVFLALSLGAAAATVGFLHAGQQRDLAENRLAEITREQENNRELIRLLRDMYPRPWGMQTLGRNYTVYDSIEKISPTLETRLQDHPVVEIKVRQIFADAYMSAGEFDKAREHLYKALRLAEEIYGGQPHVTIAEIHATLADEIGWNYDDPLDHAKLLEHAEKAIEINETLGIEWGGLISALFAKGQCLLAMSPHRKAEAEQAQRRVVAVGEHLGSTSVISLWDLGLVLMALGDDRLDDAQREFEKALLLCQNNNCAPMEKSTVLSGLGRCLRRKGDIAGAIKAFDESWVLFQSNDELKNEPRGHRLGFNLVETYFAQGDLQRAFGLVNQMEEQMMASDSAPAESLVRCLCLKGWLHYQLEDYAHAAELFDKSMVLAKERFGERSVAFGYPCMYLALTHEALEQNDDAAKAFRQVLPVSKRFVDMSPHYEIAHWSYGYALGANAGNDGLQLENAWEVANTGHASVAAWSRPWLEPAFYLIKAKLRLQLDHGDRSRAIELLENGLTKAQEPHATFRSSQWDVPTTRNDLECLLARLYLEEGNSERAKKVLEQAVQIRDDALGAQHIQTAMAQLRLGEFLVTNSAKFDVATAEEPLVSAYNKLVSHSEGVDALRRRAANTLFELYQVMDRPDDAAAWQAKVSGSIGQIQKTSPSRRKQNEKKAGELESPNRTLAGQSQLPCVCRAPVSMVTSWYRRPTGKVIG